MENVPYPSALNNAKVHQLHKEEDVIYECKEHLHDFQFVSKLGMFSPFENIKE